MSAPWPSETEIAAGQGDPITGAGFDRRWSMFDFSDCRHGLMVGFVLDEGWAVDVCVKCGHAESLGCQHPESEWNDAGTLLRCKTCGMDGT